MERRRLIIDFILGAALVFLAAFAWSQSGELSKLDEQLARMEARLDAVDGKGSPVPTLSTADSPEARAVEVEQRAMDDPSVAPVAPNLRQAAGEDPELDVSDPAVRGQLREVIQEEQELLRAERNQERQERREQRLRQQVRDLAERTTMDADTTEQITDLLVVEQVEAMELFRQAREDFSWDETRDKVAALRKDTDAQAKDLLDEEEYAEYQKMREEEMDRWNRGPRRGRGDGERAPETRGRGEDRR